MQIVIDIPEMAYNLLKSDTPIDWLDAETLLNQIVEGIVLHNGHGDLITKEQAIELVEYYQINPQNFDFVNLIDEIKNEKPIIPAQIK